MLDILMYVVVAAVYSMSMFLKKALKTENPAEFDKMKLLATGIVGAGVGLMLGNAGIVPTELGIEAQLTGMVGLIVLVENGLHVILRGAKRLLAK